MNHECLWQLYRHVKAQDTLNSCQFEVTDEGESGIMMIYQSTAALSSVTVVGSPSPCVSSCRLYQGTGDAVDQVRILYDTCICVLVTIILNCAFLSIISRPTQSGAGFNNVLKLVRRDNFMRLLCPRPQELPWPRPRETWFLTVKLVSMDNLMRLLCPYSQELIL